MLRWKYLEEFHWEVWRPSVDNLRKFLQNVFRGRPTCAESNADLKNIRYARHRRQFWPPKTQNTFRPHIYHIFCVRILIPIISTQRPMNHRVKPLCDNDYANFPSRQPTIRGVGNQTSRGSNSMHSHEDRPRRPGTETLTRSMWHPIGKGHTISKPLSTLIIMAYVLLYFLYLYLIFEINFKNDNILTGGRINWISGKGILLEISFYRNNFHFKL